MFWLERKRFVIILIEAKRVQMTAASIVRAFTRLNSTWAM